MTDSPTPAELDIEPRRRSPWRNLSLVWLVPILAILISLGVAWKSYSDRGVLVDIYFQNAAGVTAGETPVKYRDVVIGVAESVGFTQGLDKVKVSARINRQVAEYLNDTAQFWVVRPQVSTQGVTGLSTVLSGVYIEGAWEQTGGEAVTRFEGLEERPLVDVNEKGTRVTLQSKDGNVMAAGLPVFYRGIRVGRTESPRLDAAGTSVLVEAFIEAPHDRLLTTATRFWDTTGFKVSFGPGGLRLDVGSFATLISGGVAFNTFFSGGDPVEEGQVYRLYEDEETARENAFARVSANVVTLATIFENGVSGLSPGAEVNYKGLRIGEVETLSAFVDPNEDNPVVRQMVTLQIDPGLLGLSDTSSQAEVLEFLENAVESGVRARLAKANLLTAALIVELASIPNAPPAEIDTDAEPYPLIPSVKADLPDVNASLEGVMERINKLKIEELIQQATSTLASIERIATNEKTREAPEAIVGLIEDARVVVSSSELRALPGDLRQAVTELRAVIAEAQEKDLVSQLYSALDSAEKAADSVYDAADAVPPLVEDLRAVAEKAQALKADELIAAATGFLESADALIDSDGARALPGALTKSLDEMRAILVQLREGQAVDNVNATLASVRDASTSLQAAAADLPKLADRLGSLANRAEQLIGAYDGRSDFNSETLSMLREVRLAARNVAALVRTLERSPNSILFGK